MKTTHLFLFALCFALLGGCGNKGALYLPGDPSAPPDRSQPDTRK